MGHSKNSSQREIPSDIDPCQEIRKISSKQPDFIPKGTRKERTNRACVLVEWRK